MQHRRRVQFALAAGVGLFGFGCGSNQVELPSRDDASGSVIIVSPDAGFHVPDFSCDGSTEDREAAEPSDARRETGTCTVQNSSVRFQTDVLPVFQGCSGEVCHAPWSYRTTVDIMATECCDRRRIVDPGNPDASYLIQKIRGIELCGNSSKMGNVTPEIASAIADWICLGALDD